MAKGYLTVNVYDKSVANPIGGATVLITGDNYEKSFTTDSNGKTPLIELNAPDKKYSLFPQKEVRPYSIYSVKASKQGYETEVVNGVQVLPDETSIQNIYLHQEPPTIQAFSTQSISGSTSNTEVTDLPPHSLREEAKASPTRYDLDGMRTYPNVLVPEYVIVHNGAPTDTSAANYYVPFIDYIKNVASGEIYSTWPRESLKANIYAIISFTLSRVYSEWYKSQGYNFTVTSLPKYDQSYVNNRTIFKTISDITDEIFDYYIEIPGREYPFLAQYDDGIDTNNPGWLSQWGSKSLADQGYDALRILRYYYVNTLTLEKADETEGLPTSFPGYNLALGSCGESVQKIQIMINAISNNYPAIPKIIPTDGVYNNNTSQSVKAFQQVFNIPNTGVVDITTWNRISYVYVAVTKMLKGVK
jgi:hypothetical protein